MRLSQADSGLSVPKSNHSDKLLIGGSLNPQANAGSCTLTTDRQKSRMENHAASGANSVDQSLRLSQVLTCGGDLRNNQQRRSIQAMSWTPIPEQLSDYRTR